MKFCIISITLLIAVTLSTQIPCLKKNEYGITQMVVKGKPFLMLSGEVYNSSASDSAYMEKTMKSLKEAIFKMKAMVYDL